MRDMGMTPKALASRPTLKPRLGYYYAAYNRLSRSRDASMAGPLPIKVSEVLAYCTLLEIRNVEERVRLFDHIACLDDAYLEYLKNRNQVDVPRSQKEP
jgi:hypothetical protein